MARLNEPPALAPAPSTTAAQPGVESADAVKRRFTRQNRELAKHNSNQSLKIRSLEIEVAKLQADNLSLEKQNVQLQKELKSARSGQVSGDVVRTLREELQAKLAELSGLVEGIDALVHTAEDAEVDVARDKKPLEGQWRERQPLTEAMRENQMPTITEDKQYPRQTLGADEIQAIRLSDQGSNESPDLGPPPVAHFDYEDPIKQLSLSAKEPSTETAEEEDEELPASLSVNLETRRRRKDGHPKLDIRRHSIISQSPTKIDSEPSTILRTGAKRKLADRDLEKTIIPPAKGDFTFSRKGTASDSKVSGPPSVAEDASAPGEQAVQIVQDASATPPRPARKVLGDRSVNMSPRKAPAPAAPEKAGKDAPEKLTKPAAPRSASATARKRRVSAIPQPLLHEDVVVPTVELAPPIEVHPSMLAPQTPAPPDLFSPTPSEASAARPADESTRAGTPPPSDLSTLSVPTDGGGMRPSRRARAAVNYTEPSLNAKIRRPGKGMVDAVTGLVDPRRAMSASVSKASLPRTVVVKKEPIGDDEADEVDWRSLPSAADVAAPASPLAPRSVEVGGSDPLALQVDDPVTQADNPSAASATISALMAGGRRRRRESIQHLQHPPEDVNDDVAAKMEELDLYDFKDSSSPPTSADKSDALSGNKFGGGGAVKSKGLAGHRRHSSVPKALPDKPGLASSFEGGTAAVVASSAAVSGSTAGMVAGQGGGGRWERAASRRRSMML
ncbi:hypothetical protein B0A55_00557 [Friedmanniomyces simplex]|uniref:Shugoshin C-terminal domain-containing protein n=1 Tax=Friedmanniomyces simplex TaxID=329884 RepID=A0A4U0Y3V8_9PEZI|nr:hypothetical protein B0A55_00557 [Friedmanniomyces simplex]